MTEAERQAELERLIEEQRKDDTHLVRHDHNVRESYSFDAMYAGPDGGGEAMFANLIGLNEDGEIVSFVKPFKGDILNGTAEYHGTEDGYTNRGCRCPRCRRANTVANLRRRAKRNKAIPERVHGSENGYTNYGCRCERCRVAHREDYKRRQEQKFGTLEEQTCANPECSNTFTPRDHRKALYCSPKCKNLVGWRRKKDGVNARRRLKAAA